ncbi:hypothetical protein [Saccharothrix sp. ST-888]|uniref:hypothetical protein n=1 Tax=Saccharothrix sp. ST-888 TaxID=1427391 RepID=UPI0005ECD572|nr:hypothetical protein [Saccharothrix sp. ST-888]KJK59662.1 hypothetical protein UK12_03035 [Saccharothrix sp. ST-888]
MPCLQRAVLLRAAVAALTLCAALGVEAAVGHALAARGAERAERDAYVCSEAARSATALHTGAAHAAGRPAATRAGRCER